MLRPSVHMKYRCSKVFRPIMYKDPYALNSVMHTYFAELYSGRIIPRVLLAFLWNVLFPFPLSFMMLLIKDNLYMLNARENPQI